MRIKPPSYEEFLKTAVSAVDNPPKESGWYPSAVCAWDCMDILRYYDADTGLWSGPACAAVRDADNIHEVLRMRRAAPSMLWSPVKWWEVQ